MESFTASIAGAMRTEKDDPVGILLPTAAILLLQLAVVLLAREGVWSLDWVRLILVLLALEVVRRIVSVPFRAAIIAAGARSLHMPVGGWTRSPSLLGVQLVIGAVQGLAISIAAVVTWIVVGLLVTRGWYGLGTTAAGVGICLGGLATLLIRVGFAYAPIRAVAGRESPWRALRHGTPSGGDWLRVLGVLALGDLAIAVGSVFCGAGALPAYPLGDLALLHRWKSDTTET